MAKHQPLAHFEQQLAQQELMLIEQQEAVADFIASPHHIKDVQLHLASVRTTDTEIRALLSALVSYRQTTPSKFKAAADGLCQRCRNLQQYTRDMRNDLNSNLTDMRLAHNAESVNHIETFGFPITIAVAAQTLFKTNPQTTKDILVAGFLGASSIAFRKRIYAVATATRRTATSLPQAIVNDFRFYYAKELLKQRAKVVGAFCKSGTSTLMRLSKRPIRQDNKPAENLGDAPKF